jgi:hypothetical protein
VTLPQQPLPVLQALQSTTQSKPIVVMSAAAPKPAAAAPAAVNSDPKPAAAAVSQSSLLPASLSLFAGELCGPPDDIFDSEDAATPSSSLSSVDHEISEVKGSILRNSHFGRKLFGINFGNQIRKQNPIQNNKYKFIRVLYFEQ